MNCSCRQLRPGFQEIAQGPKLAAGILDRREVLTGQLRGMKVYSEMPPIARFPLVPKFGEALMLKPEQLLVIWIGDAPVANV